MAYTDSRYDLPNVEWLEMKFPDVLKDFQSKHSDEKIFFTVFAMLSDAVITENAGYNIVNRQFTKLAESLKNSEQEILTAAGIDMGFSISVDDFGAGYSSFSLLSSLPMDIMKIDRSILTGADSSPKMKTILGKVIELGHSLGMDVICEGIETVEEENLLLSLGCRYEQGFFDVMKKLLLQQRKNFGI